MKALVAVLGVVVVGLVVVSALDRWREGAIVIGVALCFAAALRVALSGDRVGDLAVRSRALDGAVLLVLGLGLVALANTIPGR